MKAIKSVFSLIFLVSCSGGPTEVNFYKLELTAYTASRAAPSLSAREIVEWRQMNEDCSFIVPPFGQNNVLFFASRCSALDIQMPMRGDAQISIADMDDFCSMYTAMHRQNLIVDQVGVVCEFE